MRASALQLPATAVHTLMHPTIRCNKRLLRGTVGAVDLDSLQAHLENRPL